MTGEVELQFSDIVAAIRRRGFYLNLLPYFLLLIPFIVALNMLARRIDARFGLQPFFGEPARMVLFILFTCAGVAVVWWSYAYLVILGDGSPSPHLGGTRRLVRSGPYSAVRHPSVIGKLLGVIGAGWLFASPTFMCGMLPLLLAWSLGYNRFYQEMWCVRQFGDAYLEYRKEVPFIVPSPRRVVALVKAPGNAQWLGAWVLLCVLFLQAYQVWWLSVDRQTRYVWVPLSFSSGDVSVPTGPVVDGPAVVGPTITIEDIVRGLVVMEEHPEHGLSLDASQRKAMKKYLDEASQARDDMLKASREAAEADSRDQALAAQMLEVLTEAQKKYLREHRALDAAAPPASTWDALVRYLEAGPP